MVAEQIIEIPESREVRFIAPEIVPTGSVRVFFVFESNGNSGIDGTAYQRNIRGEREKRLAALERLDGLTKDNPVSVEDGRGERLARQYQ